MTSAPKPTIVLVHGSWHVPEHAARYVAGLRSAGFDVVAPALPTCDKTQYGSASMYADAEVVRSAVLTLLNEAKEVVMVLHSYGGIPGTEALEGLSKPERHAQGLPGGVVRLVYMCAFILPVGGCLLDQVDTPPEASRVVVDREAGTTTLDRAVETIYADVEPEYAEEMAALLVPQVARALKDPVTYAAWKHIPSVYLKAEQDKIVFPEWQDRMVKAVRDSGVDIKVESFKSSHSPFLSMPDEMVKAVERTLVN